MFPISVLCLFLKTQVHLLISPKYKKTLSTIKANKIYIHVFFFFLKTKDWMH